jgi:hypothetical protein
MGGLVEQLSQVFDVLTVDEIRASQDEWKAQIAEARARPRSIVIKLPIAIKELPAMPDKDIPGLMWRSLYLFEASELALEAYFNTGPELVPARWVAITEEQTVYPFMRDRCVGNFIDVNDRAVFCYLGDKLYEAFEAQMQGSGSLDLST